MYFKYTRERKFTCKCYIVPVSVNAIIQILIRQIHILLGQVGEKILEVLNKNAFLKCTYYCSKSNLAIIVTNHAQNVRYSPSFGRELSGIRYRGLRRCLAMAVSFSLHNEGSIIIYIYSLYRKKQNLLLQNMKKKKSKVPTPQSSSYTDTDSEEHQIIMMMNSGRYAQLNI